MEAQWKKLENALTQIMKRLGPMSLQILYVVLGESLKKTGISSTKPGGGVSGMKADVIQSPSMLRSEECQGPLQVYSGALQSPARVPNFNVRFQRRQSRGQSRSLPSKPEAVGPRTRDAVRRPSDSRTCYTMRESSHQLGMPSRYSEE